MISRRSLHLIVLFVGLLSYRSVLRGNEDACCQNTCGQIFTIAPEVYHLERTRKGGTEQSGTLVGARFNYDHIKRYQFYWGLQGFYGSGELRGKNGSRDRIHSRLTDAMAEADLGYTLASKVYPYYSLTPFVGGGYFWETNQFHHPTPLKIKLTTRFWYGAFGFLSRMAFFNDWMIGLNARFKALWQTKCTISHDPENDSIKQQVGDRVHYRIELPISYCKPLYCGLIRIGVMPFYESRVYGGRENYPFDFFETKYRIYGIDLQFIYEY